jgi:hypothetical protein
MILESQLKLQSYLDGELSAGEVREVESWLAADNEPRLLLAELRNTNTALAGYEVKVQLPESREFYWSKINREIQGLEKPGSRSLPVTTYRAWRRILILVGALAVVTLAAVFVAPRLGNFGGTHLAVTETALADSGAFTYRDYRSGTTLVWLSYPPENQFAETDSTDTIR